MAKGVGWGEDERTRSKSKDYEEQMKGSLQEDFRILRGIGHVSCAKQEENVEAGNEAGNGDCSGKWATVKGRRSERNERSHQSGDT